MIQHLLTQRLVGPVPTLWAIAIAALFGKGSTLLLEKQHHQRQLLAVGIAGTGTVVIVGLVGLQLYLAGGILIPWLLPSAIFLLDLCSSFN